MASSAVTVTVSVKNNVSNIILSTINNNNFATKNKCLTGNEIINDTDNGNIVTYRNNRNDSYLMIMDRKKQNPWNNNHYLMIWITFLLVTLCRSTRIITMNTVGIQQNKTIKWYQECISNSFTRCLMCIVLLSTVSISQYLRS